MTKQKVSAQVYLESDAYGSEEFEYDTLNEALKGVARLARDVAKCTEEDGVERKIILVIKPLEED